MRTCAALLALLVLPLLGVAQPAVAWLEESHDFGLIREQDGKAACRFVFVNTGDSALVISTVRTSCGCTASEFPRTAIAAGDTSEITVTYNPARRPGAFEKEIFVYTNAKPQRSMLTIRGTVLADDNTLIDQYPVAIGTLRLESASLPLGEVKRGKARHSHINVLNNTLEPLAVGISGAPSHIRATITPDTIAPGEGGVLSVDFRSAEAPLWGLNIDTLSLSVTQNGATATGEVLTMAIVADDFSKLTDEQRARAPHISVDTNLLNDFARLPDGTYRATLTIKNAGRDRLEIRRLWSGESALSFRPRSLSVKRGKSTTVDVIVDPSLLSDTLLNSSFTIITNDPDSPATSIRVAMLANP